MPIEFEHPIVAEIETKELEIGAAQMKRIWDIAAVANSQIKTGKAKQFPRSDQLKNEQKAKLNERIKMALQNQGIIVVHHGQFALVLDATQNAYYQIEGIDASRILSGRNKRLKTKALSGKPNANISFEKDSAWINVYLDNNAFSHLLYGPDYPGEIPLIYEIPKDPKTPIVLFGYKDASSNNRLFLEESAA